MTHEFDTIHKDNLPLTARSLTEQFEACGLEAGQIVLVHSSLSRMGWVAGGPVAVIQALLGVLGTTGTLIMPTHTSANTDPAHWRNPPVPEHWWPIIRENMPAYSPALTPTRHMGDIPELFRTWPGVMRSKHPIGSFAAVGPEAEYLTDEHSLEEPFGEHSPIGRLYELDGYILLLGVGHDNNTSLHLAEYRANYSGKRTVREGTAMLVDGVRKWVEFETLKEEVDDFATIGEAFEQAHPISLCKVGRAETRFMKQRPLVDFAVQWMNENRDFTKS